MTRGARLLAPLALLLVALAAAWWWSGGDTTPRLMPNGDVAASDGTSAERSGERGEAGASGSLEGGSAAAIAAARAADAIDPLAIPEPHEIDAIESEGRVLFWGVVVAPDSRPCAGATILHDGKVAATSDEQGRYRVAVEQRTWDDSQATTRGFEHYLHARKAGVGVAQKWCGGSSRRVDLMMIAGCAVSGRVRRRGSDEAVAGARIEFQVPSSQWGPPMMLVSLETTSDGDGRFAFDSLMGGRIALRATADEWASCGWFEFDVHRVKGRHGIDFELQPVMTAKGWFAPWPPAGVERAAAAKAQVAVVDGQIASPATPPEPARATVAEDGTFQVRFAATTALELRLELADGIAWRRELDLPWEPRDVDLGRIELDAPARVSGELALPPELLELGFDFAAEVDAADGTRTLRAPIGSDGRFLSPPLPLDGSVSIGIVLGDHLAVPLSLQRVDERTGEIGEFAEELAPGETREFGRIVPTGVLLAGRVVDPRGGPTADTLVTLVCGEGDEATRVETVADAKGRWLLAIHEYSTSPWLVDVLEKERSRVLAWRHAALVVLPLPRPLADGVVERIDLVLGDGERASGRVVDERGEPRRHAQLQLLPWQGIVEGGNRPVMIWTDGDGRFATRGLAPGKWSAVDYEREGSEIHPLDALVVPCSDVTLRRRAKNPAAERK